ncbi:MAG: CapA family protein [Erythrobacter sp.]
MTKTWAICGSAIAAILAGPVAKAGSNGNITAKGSIAVALSEVAPADISISVNGLPTKTTEDGAYSVEAEVLPYYQVRIEGPSIHTSIQTFGIAEIYRKDCDCLRLPRIEVVARKEGRIELFFAGDAMAGRRYVEPIWGERQLVDPVDPLPDIRALLQPMQPYVESADFASVNLEIVLSDRDFGNAPPKTVTFYAPPALAQALADTGFDHVTLGNNHAYDFLDEGLAATISAVEEAGLEWSGAGHDEVQALRAAQVDVGGHELSFLGYVGWKGTVEPNQVAETGKGGAAHGSDANIASSVGGEAALGRIPIVQYHGSREYSDGPTEESERRMKLAVDSGAALVASHHPHVPQGLELYNGALIAYSSGNFLFDQYFLETHGSFVLRAWLDDGKFVRGEIIPTRVLDYRPVPAVGSMREAVLGRVRRLSMMRGTRIDRNGGHGVIVPRNAIDAAEKACPVSLDLLRGGDFESAQYGAARDRSLKSVGAVLSYVFDGREGHHAELDLRERSENAALMPSTFFRVFPGDQVTVSGRIRSGQATEISLDIQQREEGVGRMEALEDGPITIADRTVVPAGSVPSDFALTVTLDRDAKGSLPPFRPILRFKPSGERSAEGSKVWLDDLRIVSTGPEACPVN